LARKKREWYPGMILHVMNRGGNHRNMFMDDSDYEFFIMLLRNLCGKYDCIVHAYCLMTNHYHILLETGQKEIWHIMKRLDQTYTGYFNEKYRRDGALLRGRYKSCVVNDDAYFLQTSRYICLNPVNAKMTALPSQYKWSSYRTIIGDASDGITDAKKTLLYFKDSNITLFRDFVESHITRTDEIDLIISKGMGDEEWLPW